MAKIKPWMKLKQIRDNFGQIDFKVEIDRRGKWVWMERELLRRGARVIHTASGKIVITRAVNGNP